MNRNPYRIEGPACISFSGGRSSGYMLKHILDAHGGTLPDDVHVCFANTGKEREATLRFVAACAEAWAVPIRWLEYDPAAEDRTREVTFGTASRNGEPFEAMIRRKGFLPNPVARFCTTELKIRRCKHLMLRHDYEQWEMVLGFRADEPRRVAKLQLNSSRERWDNVAPMAQAGVTKEDVAAFWKAQPFDLALPNHGGVTPAGNCDLCFLKGRDTVLQLIRENPGSADWWIRMEALALASKPSGANFRTDRPSYEEMRKITETQDLLPITDTEAIPCFCGD